MRPSPAVLAPPPPAEEARTRPAPALLLTVPVGPVRFPWWGLAFALGATLFVAAVLVVLAARLLGPFAPLLGLLVLVCGFAVAAYRSAVGPFRAARSRSLAIDEGGVRFRAGADCSYWPFAMLGQATIEATGIFPVTQRSLLLHTPTHGLLFEVTVLGDDAAEIQRMEEVVAAIDVGRGVGALPAPPVAAAIARRDRPVMAWREALDALATRREDHGYRGAALDLDALLAIAADARQESELRAGALYVLLASGLPETRAAARRLLGVGAPPIVLWMAWTSPGGSALGIDAAVRAAAPYLVGQVESDELEALATVQGSPASAS